MRTTRALMMPLSASGGIADDSGLVAALMLSAEGVNMGARLFATREAPIHDEINRTLRLPLQGDPNNIVEKGTEVCIKDTPCAYGA